MNKICVFTGSRAEYGLLKPVIKALQSTEVFEVSVLVSGSHLSPEFGMTVKEIEADGIPVDAKIEMLLSADTPSSISKSMGLAMIGFADYFQRKRPDLLVVLGDRYEILAAAIVAMNERIPIAHLYGGEITYGAIDESVRHAVTKLSCLHFTSTDVYRRRVIQLGEHPSRVFNVGAIGIENASNESLMTMSELEEYLNFKLKHPYALGTYHSVTLEYGTSEEHISNLMEVCRERHNIMFLFTKANADSDGRIINSIIDEYAKVNEHIKVVSSMGSRAFLSAMKYCDMVIGNSSSGLIEAPSFGIPTINIGDRQKGRLQADSVINCRPTKVDINLAIARAVENATREKARATINPYGDGNVSSKVVEIIRDAFQKGSFVIKKEFYSCEVKTCEDIDCRIGLDGEAQDSAD